MGRTLVGCSLIARTSSVRRNQLIKKPTFEKKKKVKKASIIDWIKYYFQIPLRINKLYWESIRGNRVILLEEDSHTGNWSVVLKGSNNSTRREGGHLHVLSGKVVGLLCGCLGCIATILLTLFKIINDNSLSKLPTS